MARRRSPQPDADAGKPKQLRKRLRKAEDQLADAQVKRDRAQARVEALSIITDEIRAQLADADKAAQQEAHQAQPAAAGARTAKAKPAATKARAKPAGPTAKATAAGAKKATPAATRAKPTAASARKVKPKAETRARARSGEATPETPPAGE